MDLTGFLLRIVCLWPVVAFGNAQAQSPQDQPPLQTCLYESQSYSAGAYLCVQKSLMLSCFANNGHPTWQVVADKDLNKLCPEPFERAYVTLRPDPDRVLIKDAELLRELGDRLYEHNFDPESPDAKNGMRFAIGKFQEKSGLMPTGEATEGVLTRLRKMDDLKPWGSIVYGPDNDKWGISWNHPSRKAAVADARSNCGAGKCPVELSFYGRRCGAFAVSEKSWSLVQGETVQRTKDVALAECGKTGKTCRIVAAVCADGSGRQNSNPP